MFLSIIAIVGLIIAFNRINNLANQIFKLEKKVKELSSLTPGFVQPDKEQHENQPQHANTQTSNKAPFAHSAATVCQANIQTPPPADKHAENPSLTKTPQQAAPLTQVPQPQLDLSAAPTNSPATKPEKPLFTFSPIQLLSWIGGFTFVLAVAFWIKYAIDNNMFSPAMRIGIGVATGLVLLAIGLLMNKNTLKTTSNTLCGVGLTALYLSVYGAYVFYQMLAPSLAFGLMGTVALASFGVAVWKNTKYIGFLAEIISFITPLLLSFEQWNLSFFFIYIAFINIAAAGAALWRKWDSVLIGSVIFTFLAQLIAFAKGGTSLHPAQFCVFSALYAVAAAFAARKYTKQLKDSSRNFLGFFIAGNLLFTFLGLSSPSLSITGSFYFLALGIWLNLVLVYLTSKDNRLHIAAWRTGQMFVFIALSVWASRFGYQLNPLFTLGTFAAFAAVNGGADLFLYKRQALQPGYWAIIFPVLLMLPAGALSGQNGLFSIYILVLALMGISVLFALAAKRPLAALWGCLIAFAILLVIKPEGEGSPLCEIAVLALSLFPALFVCAAARWLFPPQFIQTHTPVYISALMPYLLTLGAVEHLSEHLGWVLGFTLALNALCIFFAYIYRNGKLLPAAWLGSTLLQTAGFFALQNQFAPAFISWVLALNAVFVLMVFVFKQRFEKDKEAWSSAALAGISACLFTLLTAQRYLNIEGSWVSAGFALLYGGLTYYVYGWQRLEEGIQRTRIAWLGGVTLLFITAFFPLYFDTQWVSVAWALEGGALVWLSNKTQYTGPQKAGFWLMVLSFLLTLFATHYTVQEGISLFNRFLYVFGVTAVALLYSATKWNGNASSAYVTWLKILGGLLLFILLHIEIAVSFTQESGPLQLDVFGSFNSAIAYTVGWTIFGSVLLLLGLGKKGSRVSVVGFVLIGAGLFKLFFSDIWALGGLYRIFGLVGVAIVLIGISFLFQLLHKKS